MEALMDVSQWAGTITILLLAACGLLKLIFGIFDSIDSEPWGPEAFDRKDRNGGTRG